MYRRCRLLVPVSVFTRGAEGWKDINLISELGNYSHILGCTLCDGPIDSVQKRELKIQRIFTTIEDVLRDWCRPWLFV